MKTIIGGISENGRVYNSEEKNIEIRGWFYPEDIYDEIEIWYSNMLLGKAKVHLERRDVYNNFKDEKALNTGFLFEMGDLIIKNDDWYFLLIVKNKGKVVHHIVNKFEELSYQEKIEKCAKKMALSQCSKIYEKKSVCWIKSKKDIKNYNLKDSFFCML